MIPVTAPSLLVVQSSATFMTKSTVLSCVSICVAAFCSACADRLSAPEAARLVNALEGSLASDAKERPGRLEDRMGEIGRNFSRLRGASSVELHRDGHALTYRAVVFEYVMAPPAGLDTSGCAGTRWVAYFWRDGGLSDGLRFMGGQFRQRLAPPRSCREVNYSDPQPSLLAYPPDQNVWLATDGDGDISPGVVIGECAFLEPEAAGFLREERGITCALTRHRVRFRAQIQRDASPSPPSFAFDPAISRVELGPTEVIGVRITVDCDAAERRLFFCAPHRSIQPH